MSTKTIEPQDELYRRFYGYHVKPDGTVSSAAFMTRSKKPDPSVSVHLARITSAETCLQMGVAGQGAIVLVAAVPLTMGLEVVIDPQLGDPGHCLINGLSSREECVRLARSSRIIIAPPEKQQ